MRLLPAAAQTRFRPFLRLLLACAAQWLLILALGSVVFILTGSDFLGFAVSKLDPDLYLIIMLLASWLSWPASLGLLTTLWWLRIRTATRATSTKRFDLAGSLTIAVLIGVAATARVVSIGASEVVEDWLVRLAQVCWPWIMAAYPVVYWANRRFRRTR